MNLQHIEELAKDKDLTNAYFCSCLSNFYKEDTDVIDNCKEDYDFESVREWKDLTNEEKETLIESATYYWVKDESGASIGKICDLVMFNQNEILQDQMDKWDFLEQLCNF